MTDRQRIRVFVVDDETVIATTLTAILKQSGFDAVAFTNPLQALAAAGEKIPDLLISDVVMPQLSGIDLAIQLQEKAPACKILLFSGQAATADLLSSAREKGHDFALLSKPVHPTDLLNAIRSLNSYAGSD
jgi:DNA-binding NtrC family response regulator